MEQDARARYAHAADALEQLAFYVEGCEGRATAAGVLRVQHARARGRHSHLNEQWRAALALTEQAWQLALHIAWRELERSRRLEIARWELRVALAAADGVAALTTAQPGWNTGNAATRADDVRRHAANRLHHRGKPDGRLLPAAYGIPAVDSASRAELATWWMGEGARRMEKRPTQGRYVRLLIVNARGDVWCGADDGGHDITRVAYGTRDAGVAVASNAAAEAVGGETTAAGLRARLRRPLPPVTEYEFEVPRADMTKAAFAAMVEGIGSSDAATAARMAEAVAGDGARTLALADVWQHMDAAWHRRPRGGSDGAPRQHEPDDIAWRRLRAGILCDRRARSPTEGRVRLAERAGASDPGEAAPSGGAAIHVALYTLRVTAPEARRMQQEA